MSQIANFAWKELYTVFRDRNLILIMFLTPIVLSTIMGLAFGGLGGGSDSSSLTNIPIAIVNLDEGFSIGDNLPTEDGEIPSLNNLEFEIGGEMVNVGDLLLQNDNLELETTDLDASDAGFNFGEQLTTILLSEEPTEELTSTEFSSDTVLSAGGFDIDDLTCPLTDEDGAGTTSDDPTFGFEGTLADLFDAVEVADPDVARRGVETGEYVAAIIIPATFSNDLSPDFGFGSDTESESSNSGSSNSGSSNSGSSGAVEVYANQGQSIKASIVRAVVEGIVNQLVTISAALDSVLNAGFDSVADQLLSGTIDLATLSASGLQEGFQSVDATILEPLGCLVLPDAGNIQLTRQPLDATQEASAFGFIMVLLGSSQAIFFALFTGIFGMNSIYEERDNGTLHRLFAAPMPRYYILIGKMIGNLVVVAAQLTILFLAFTVITSLVEGDVNFIWGTNLPLLAATILAISLFVSGVGVLVVGLAATSEQVQTFGPIVSAGLGALGGSFGFRLPAEVASISPVWWGSEALKRLAAGQSDIFVPLLVLFGVGLAFFSVGSLFFKRRMQL